MKMFNLKTYTTEYKMHNVDYGHCSFTYLCNTHLVAYMTAFNHNVTVVTARCTLVQSVVLRSHVVCLSVCLSVRL